MKAADKLSAEKIIALLGSTINLTVHDKLTSTNTYLLDLPGDYSTPVYCLAEEQTAGRGRMGRVWQSPQGENIYFSMRIDVEQPLGVLADTSVAIGKELIVILQLQFPGLVFTLKWPNDILVDGKKLVGILVETRSSADKTAVVIGIGVNVNMLDHHSIDQAWTSLRQLTGEMIDRNVLVAAMINGLGNNICNSRH